MIGEKYFSKWLFLFSYVSYQSINCIINIILKSLASTPRPHFYDTCSPDWDRVGLMCDDNNSVKFDISLCDKYDDSNYNIIMDSMKSFPSGHSQLSLCCGVFLVLYLHRRLTSSYNLTLIQMMILTLSLFCAVSRLLDHRHHLIDVVTGSIIGAVVGHCALIDAYKELQFY